MKSPLALLLSGAVLLASANAAEREIPAKLQPFFAPPAEFARQFGRYASPLKFYDGRPVASPAEWPARRAEILKYWHAQMGPWPELLARPKLELLEKQMRDGIAQHRVRIEVAPGVMQHGFLLVPPGSAPRPAVLVPYYVPEVSVGYQGPLEGQAKKMMEGGRGKDRDFALQLARRGFVTLAIGSPEGDAYRAGGTSCQRLSYLAYIAANCHTALAQRPEVDPASIGVMGHSYGGKWSMFASCLYEKFAAAVWCDGGVVFDEARPSVNYWEPWYLGFDPKTERKRGLVTPDNPRTGAYKTIFESEHDLHELHALMAPRPFLVSGGSEDFPARWIALNHAVAVNEFLGHKNRVAMTNRRDHSPNAESNEQAFLFLETMLGPVTATAKPTPRLAATSWLEANGEAPAGMAYRTFHSRTIDREVSFLIYLPPSYETEKEKRCPVVYWLHGLGGNQRACAAFVSRVNAAIKTGKGPEMIVIGVNGLGSSRYTDSFDGKRPVETVIVKDLVPHIDETYRTIARREARGLEGQSMGGQGSAYLGFKYPQLFGVVSTVGAALHDADAIQGGGDPKEWDVIVKSARRKALFIEVFGGNIDYFNANNAWTVVEKNADAIRGKTTVRILVGDKDPLLGPNRRYHELLERLKIPHTFQVAAGAPHSFPQVYDKLGSNPLQFYVDAFAKLPR